MKVKLIPLMFLIIINSKSIAQEFSLQVGFTNPTVDNYWLSHRYSEHHVFKSAFQIGPIMQIPFNNTSTVKTGMLLHLKGYHEYDEGSDFVYENFLYDMQINLWYLEFPFLLNRNFEFRRSSFFMELGPYYAIALNANVRLKNIINGETTIEHEKFKIGSNKINTVRRGDYGLNIGVGARIKAISLGLSYSLGLRNILNSEDESLIMRNRVLSVFISFPVFEYNKTPN